MNIKGTVTRIFAEKESGFKILVVSVRDMRCIPQDKRNPDFPGSVTLIGVMKGVQVDYVIEVSGEWENRKSGNYWPWQFKVSDYAVCEFETPGLLRKFLAELPCVGAELAGRILVMFPNADEVIEKTPQRLTAIKGITAEKAQTIHIAFTEQKEKKSLNNFLRKYGVRNDEISEIAANYGSNAVKIIKSNPYRLCDDKYLSFKICDRIGMDAQIAPDAECRLKTAMNYVLNVKAGSKGHTYLTEDMLVEETNLFLHDNAAIRLSFTKETLETRLHNLTAKGEIIFESGRYYCPERYENETDVANILRRRASRTSPYADVDDSLLESCLALAEQDIGYHLDEVQRAAVYSAIRNTTTVITGGPGSGKTTLLNTYIRTLERVATEMNQRKPVISLAAPTGMASKRMSASTGREARTIHKLFDIRYDASRNREEQKTLISDVVVLDEVSMLDIDIMACILRSLKDDTVLILVGDVDQIPSIGPGNVLADIIESGIIPVARLNHSYRHGSRKTILINSNKINCGDEDLVTNRSDFVMVQVTDKSTDKDCKRLRAVTERVYNEEFLAGGKDLNRVQVISPLRSKTEVSVDELNVVLQRIANPAISEAEQITHGKIIFRKGDKVMQVSNNYDKGVFNGDTGIISLVSVQKKRIQVDYQGVKVEYSESEFDQLKHAFAATVHKVQGSEFPVVIMVVTNFHSMMLLRNLFYTGVTRAKQRIILIGDSDAVRYAIRNTKGAKRLSALCIKLKK